MKKYAIWLIIIALIALLGFTIVTTTFRPLESLMKPPKVEGENLAIQLAFEEKIGTDYVLKQPISGNRRSAYNFIDLTGNSKDEVVVFYSKADNLGIVRMNVLDNINGEWKSVADFQSVYNDIQEVEFADLNGDGNKEIIVGWSVYQDSYSKLMSVYEINDRKDTVRIYPIYGDYYSKFSIIDIDNNGKNDILTVKYATAGSSAEYTASFLSYEGIKIKEKSHFTLDKSLNSVAAINFDHTENGARIFIDGYKADSGMLTDCFAWNNIDNSFERYIVSGNSVASLTSRTSTVFCKDINSDGLIEIPMEEYLPNISVNGNKTNNLGTSLITWLWIDENYTEFVESRIILSQYGYSFKFNKHMLGNVSVINDTEKSLLTFYSLKNENGIIIKDEPLFSIMTLTEFDLDIISELSFYYSLIDQVKDKYYYCRIYDAAEEYGLNKKEIKNRIILG